MRAAPCLTTSDRRWCSFCAEGWPIRLNFEDVYQEVFLALYEARHTYEPGRPLEPWLFAIARNIAADYTRRYFSRASWEELTGAPPDRPDFDSPAAEPDLLTVSNSASSRAARGLLDAQSLSGHVGRDRSQTHWRFGGRIKGPSTSRLQGLEETHWRIN